MWILFYFFHDGSSMVEGQGHRYTLRAGSSHEGSRYVIEDGEWSRGDKCAFIEYCSRSAGFDPISNRG